MGLCELMRVFRSSISRFVVIGLGMSGDKVGVLRALLATNMLLRSRSLLVTRTGCKYFFPGWNTLGIYFTNVVCDSINSVKVYSV
jgi:hypothetical protein